MQNQKGQSSWISLSDLMTGLMLVFLLIVVMMQENTHDILVRYENTKKEIYDALDEKFAPEQQNEKLTISEDLVVRFQDTGTLFEQDQATLSADYQRILDDFIPKYLDILRDQKFEDHIHEVRIEGHTGTRSPLNPRYIDRVELSQNRARVILQYFISSDAFQNGLDDGEKKMLRFKLMATGFGDGRMVDADERYVIHSGKDPANTRRVEFRIVTDADRKLGEALRQPL